MFSSRELEAELRLERARRLLDTRVYAGHGRWIERTFDKTNTKLNLPAEFVTEEFMQDNQYCRAGMPKTEEELEALITVMQAHLKRGLPIVVYFFRGRQDAEE